MYIPIYVPNREKSQHGEVEQRSKQTTNKTPPLTKKLLDIDTHQEKENDFLQSSHSGYIDRSAWQSHA